jgi:hypothetical protein
MHMWDEFWEHKSETNSLSNTIFTIIIKTSDQTLGLFLLQDYHLLGWTQFSLADRYQCFAAACYLKHDISIYQTTKSYKPQGCSHKTDHPPQKFQRFHIILQRLGLLKFKNHSVLSFLSLVIRVSTVDTGCSWSMAKELGFRTKISGSKTRQRSTHFLSLSSNKAKTLCKGGIILRYF